MKAAKRSCGKHVSESLVNQIKHQSGLTVCKGRGRPSIPRGNVPLSEVRLRRSDFKRLLSQALDESTDWKVVARSFLASVADAHRARLVEVMLNDKPGAFQR